MPRTARFHNKLYVKPYTVRFSEYQQKLLDKESQDSCRCEYCGRKSEEYQRFAIACEVLEQVMELCENDLTAMLCMYYQVKGYKWREIQQKLGISETTLYRKLKKSLYKILDE